MEDDKRVRTVKGLLFNHVRTASQRRIRDVWAIHLLAREIAEKLDHRDGIWREWNDRREALVSH
jgi:hypothetical protein